MYFTSFGPSLLLISIKGRFWDHLQGTVNAIIIYLSNCKWVYDLYRMSADEYKVFVSHGKPDSWLAAQMARLIKECGAATFLDETDIAKGDDFKRIIHREVAQSRELIALFTPWSAQRFWVWIEIGAAWGQNKRVVAVLYGISVPELEKLGGSKAILEDINILQLNDFESYLSELRSRVVDTRNA
jgi:hypothetical protein